MTDNHFPWRRMLMPCLALATMILAIAGPALLDSEPASGVGLGSAGVCSHPGETADGADDFAFKVSWTTVEAVCIKSGDNMFGGSGHSGPLKSGTYEDGCYSVAITGGGHVVAVTRNETGSSCQKIGHVDIIFDDDDVPPTPVPTATPTATATTTVASTPTPTPPAPTLTPTASPTGTPTQSPTPTSTPVIASTATATPTLTPTPTPTVLETATNEVAVETATPRPTPTRRPSPTATPVPAEVIVPAPEPTETPTPTRTPVPAFVPTRTPTPTPTATASPTATLTPRPTAVPNQPPPPASNFSRISLTAGSGFRFTPPEVVTTGYDIGWDGTTLTGAGGVTFTAPFPAPDSSDTGDAPQDGYDALSVTPAVGTAVHVRVQTQAGNEVFTLWFPPGQTIGAGRALVLDWRPATATLSVVADLGTLPLAFDDIASITTLFAGGGDVATTNLLVVVAIMVVLLAGGSVFNKAIETNLGGFGLAGRHIPVPVTTVFMGAYARLIAFEHALAARMPRTRWLDRLLRSVVLVVVTGAIYSLIEPGVGWNRRSLALLISLVFSQGALAIFYEGGKAWLYRRSLHVDAGVALFPACTIIALVSVGISRATGFHPGFIVGFVASATIRSGARYTREQEGRSNAIVSAGLLGFSIAAWLAAVPLHELHRAEPGLLTAIAEASALAVFVVFLQGLLFSLIPLEFMDGASIWRWNRWAWVGLFVPASLLFMQTLFNQTEAYAELALSSRSFSGILVMGGYMLATFGTWAYFKWHAGQSAQHHAPGSPSTGTPGDRRA